MQNLSATFYHFAIFQDSVTSEGKDEGLRRADAKNGRGEWVGGSGCKGENGCIIIPAQPACSRDLTQLVTPAVSSLSIIS